MDGDETSEVGDEESKSLIDVATHKEAPPRAPSVTATQNYALINSNRVKGSKKLDMFAKQLYPLHRLDRLTSGLVIFGRNKQVAKKFENAFKERHIRKTYIARVLGNFKLAIDSKTSNLENSRSSSQSPFEGMPCSSGISVKPNTLLCKGFISCVDPKKSIYKFTDTYPAPNLAHLPPSGEFKYSSEPKTAETEFEFVKYNPQINQSIILCRPFTGRTHQLRAQLEFLLHPISNDPCYCPSSRLVNLDWFPRIQHSDLSTGKAKEREKEEEGSNVGKSQEGIQGTTKTEIESPDQTTQSYDVGRESITSSASSNSNDTEKEVKEVQTHASGIFLHAWKYSWPNNFEFLSPVPQWCLELFEEGDAEKSIFSNPQMFEEGDAEKSIFSNPQMDKISGNNLAIKTS